jgi:hypothetical protein
MAVAVEVIIAVNVVQMIHLNDFAQTVRSES